MIKTGDLREDSHADDDSSKKAKYVEREGNKVLSNKTATDKETELVKDFLKSQKTVNK